MTCFIEKKLDYQFYGLLKAFSAYIIIRSYLFACGLMGDGDTAVCREGQRNLVEPVLSYYKGPRTQTQVVRGVLYLVSISQKL